MKKRSAKVQARVCPKCAFVSEKPIEHCPRCKTKMAIERSDNLADKSSADSFPASDPPPY
jgi:uncharacterized paraquat-inducible protein A